MNPKKDPDEDMGDKRIPSAVGTEESMNTLILWNISKALQRNPNLDLKAAIRTAHDRLDNTRDVNKIITQSPEERHLACALLAWQELGHSTAESLYRFIEDKLDDHERDECEKITQNAKIRILAPMDQLENDETLKHQHDKILNSQECTRTYKSTKEPKSVPEKCIHKVNKDSKSNLVIRSRNSELTINNNSTHPKCVRTCCMESNTDQAKCGRLGYKESNPSSIKVGRKIEPSKSTLSNHNEVFDNNYEYITASNFCVLNNTNKTEFLRVLKCPFMTTRCNPKLKGASIDNCVDCDSCEDFDSNSLKGPVVTLPPETKVVMRFDSQSPCARHQGKKPRASEKDIMSKIDAACCMDSACAERLAELDKATTELRNRAARLARREAERAELLERAEAAWKDLELGYQRRLGLAEEKEYDMTKQTKKLIEERNSYKTACINLAKLLKERGDATEKNRQNLVQVEKEMCSLACIRMRLSEEVARSDATLTEQQIKVSQIDRDLQFKEEQTRRKLSGVQGEVESVRALTVEAERAMRAELAALREQVETVSKQLLREDNDNIKIKAELDNLRSEKLGLVEDLEGCQVSCDSRMQKKMEELKKAREKLAQLKEKVIECKCKIPIDAAVEVKRTPSLVALCSCSPEDRLLESCSCTSLRSQLLSNLLSDLFGGLQAELGDVAAQMPCQYLKCLEDRHNWDKASLVKSNLRSYFSKLLIGELDIAIATAIEKYHARWVGISCADTMRAVPDTGDANNEGWQERAIERRAQNLANKLAEQLFQERSDQLVQRAKDVVKSGPPPCECKETAVFPCLIKPPTVGSGGFTESEGLISTYWRKTCKDVTQLRVQIEDLKKESLKKEDLKLMEEKIFKLVQRPSVYEVSSISRETKVKELNNIDESNSKDTKCHNRSVNTEISSKFSTQISRPTSIRKKNMDPNSFSKRNPKKVLNEQPDRLNKNMKKLGPVQAFAVNTCLCGNQNLMPKLIGEENTHKLNTENEDKIQRKQSFSKNSNNQMPSSKHSKPISREIESFVTSSNKNKKFSSCPNDCVCFHKIPSNTSIDKLLEKLTKWRCDLVKTSQAPGVKSNITTNYDHGIENTQQKDNESNKMVPGIHSNIIYQTDCPKIPKKIINKNISADTNTSFLPNATESEYMGTINLDNSIENSKCLVKDKINKIGEKTQEPNSLFQCINSELRECKKSFEKNNDTLNINSKDFRQKFSNRNSNTNELETDANQKNFKVRDELNYQQPSQILKDKNETETSINHIVKTSELFPCDCDYYVKLLGVTLANISSQKIFNGKHAISHTKNKTNNTSNDDNTGTIDTSLNKANTKQNDKRNLQSCQCHMQFDQFKNYMENNFRKQWGDHSTNDKELDVPSFKEISSNYDETCICCNNGTINESKELEVNTFYLLEEHLRGKLEKLKKSCCKFSSLPVDEEEKLFSSILQRVKQVISSSANELICKCKEEKHSDSSWNRANTLLQEYLKTKIKKVQCLCANEGQKQECVLPKVLDEIYSLIEKDFQRLKNIYKFQKVNDNTGTSEGKNKDEEPVKDTNNNKNIKGLHEVINHSSPRRNDGKLSQSNSNLSLIVKQSISAQVLFNVGMTSKSCDAMEKEAKNIQTSESMKSIAERAFNSNKIENCDCSSMIDSFSYDTHDILVNHHICNINKVADNVEEKCASPYIGYTVDCSCKCALGTCTCIKSTVTRNNDQINNIWNDLTKDTIQSQVKYSYIMNSPSKKHDNQSINNSVIETSLKTDNRNQTSKNIESDFSDEEIVLKDSSKNVLVSNNSANTSNCNINSNDYSSKAEERDEACECRVIKPILKTTIRSESHLSNSLNMHKTQSLNCGCNMVPVCHVKMLVDNIENRIFHSKCTCDAFNARVCPIHSKRLY